MIQLYSFYVFAQMMGTLSIHASFHTADILYYFPHDCAWTA